MKIIYWYYRILLWLGIFKRITVHKVCKNCGEILSEWFVYEPSILETADKKLLHKNHLRCYPCGTINWGQRYHNHKITTFWASK